MGSKGHSSISESLLSRIYKELLPFNSKTNSFKVGKGFEQTPLLTKNSQKTSLGQDMEKEHYTLIAGIESGSVAMEKFGDSLLKQNYQFSPSTCKYLLKEHMLT